VSKQSSFSCLNEKIVCTGVPALPLPLPFRANSSGSRPGDGPGLAARLLELALLRFGFAMENAWFQSGLLRDTLRQIHPLERR
jgi:hypothetical protein